MIKCDSCGHEGEIHTFHPSMSPYSDIRCPKCNSTNNAHNSQYMKDLQAAMAKNSEDELPVAEKK
jgi:hypothetical protein